MAEAGVKQGVRQKVAPVHVLDPFQELDRIYDLNFSGWRSP